MATRKKRSKAFYHALANRNQARRKVKELQAKIEKGLKYRINGLDTTNWWLSTPQAVQRSVLYHRRQNNEQS